MKRSLLLAMRMPKTRRPRERPYEIFNTRDFGYNEGSQNLSMWALMAGIATSLLGFELYQLWQRIVARGDTCPACEAARKHYQQRVKNKEFEMNEVLLKGRVE
jgi:hypothetical protein